MRQVLFSWFYLLLYHLSHFICKLGHVERLGDEIHAGIEMSVTNYRILGVSSDEH